MIEIRPMDESYIHIDCMHHGPVNPLLPPCKGDIWQDASDLPPHPWSDEQIVDLAKKYESVSEGWRGESSQEFMREMIQRYGSCAILAWEDGKIIGQLRFYPLQIAQLLAQACPEKQPPPACSAMLFDSDAKTLWTQCIMASRPYETSEAAKQAGARKGVGLKLALGLVSWAREHGWKRIVTRAHADLDCMYGQYGAGGKAFWEKVGFEVSDSRYEEWAGPDEWKTLVETEAKEKGISTEDAWTWYQMACEL